MELAARHSACASHRFSLEVGGATQRARLWDGNPRTTPRHLTVDVVALSRELRPIIRLRCQAWESGPCSEHSEDLDARALGDSLATFLRPLERAVKRSVSLLEQCASCEVVWPIWSGALSAALQQVSVRGGPPVWPKRGAASDWPRPTAGRQRIRCYQRLNDPLQGHRRADSCAEGDKNYVVSQLMALIACMPV